MTMHPVAREINLMFRQNERAEMRSDWKAGMDLFRGSRMRRRDLLRLGMMIGVPVMLLLVVSFEVGWSRGAAQEKQYLLRTTPAGHQALSSDAMRRPVKVPAGG